MNESLNQAGSQMAEVIENALWENFLPNLLGIIGPFIVTLLAFSVIRIILGSILGGKPRLRKAVDGMLVLACLAVCVFVLMPGVLDRISAGG